MSYRSAEALDRIFRALASQPRRMILRLAARQRCAVTQFAAQLKMSEPAISKHVRVLVDAELLSKTRDWSPQSGTRSEVTGDKPLLGTRRKKMSGRVQFKRLENRSDRTKEKTLMTAQLTHQRRSPHE
jgi:DNA-binding transcriptional ArsR family regulator